MQKVVDRVCMAGSPSGTPGVDRLGLGRGHAASPALATLALCRACDVATDAPQAASAVVSVATTVSCRRVITALLLRKLSEQVCSCLTMLAGRRQVVASARRWVGPGFPWGTGRENNRPPLPGPAPTPTSPPLCGNSLEGRSAPRARPPRPDLDHKSASNRVVKVASFPFPSLRSVTARPSGAACR
jgi:hypothetical protein